jgi:hypothetical protein
VNGGHAQVTTKRARRPALQDVCPVVARLSNAVSSLNIGGPAHRPRVEGVMTATHSPHLTRRIQGEFTEMPGLKLSLAQAQRLFGLGTTECEELLRTLNDSGFLARTRDGSYVLASTAR